MLDFMKRPGVGELVDAYMSVISAAEHDAELCDADYKAKHAALDGYRTELAAVMQQLYDKYDFKRKDRALTEASAAFANANRRVVETKLRLICRLLAILFNADPGRAEAARTGFVGPVLGILIQNEDYMMRPSLPEQFEEFALRLDKAGMGPVNLDDELGDYVLSEHSTDVTEEWHMAVTVSAGCLQEFDQVVESLKARISEAKAGFKARTEEREARERAQRYETYLQLRAEFEPEKKR